MKLKVAFDMSTEASGEFIAKSKEQLGLSQEQTFAYADTINFLSDNSAAKANQLVEISNRVGGLARTQNISKETNLGFATTLLSMGKSAEVASTGLKQLYLELGKGADSKKKMEAFKILGLNPNTINKEMAKDAEGTIIKVLEKIDKLKAEDKAAVLNDLFGEQAIDSVATLANNIDKVKENLALAHSEMTAGSVDKEYANRMNTLKNIFEQTKNTLVNGLADIGEAIGPQLKESLKGWSETFKSLGNFAKTHPKLMSGIIKTIGAIAIFNLSMGLTNRFVTGPLAKTFAWFLKFGKHFKFGGLRHALTKMFPLTSRVFKAFKILGSGIGKVFLKSGKFLLKFGSIIGKVLGSGFLKIIKVIKMVGLALKAAFIANPIGFLIAAIVAVIAIFVILYKKVEWFRDGVNKIFEGLKLWFGGIWDIIVGIFTGNFDLIKKGFSSMVDGLKAIWDGLVGIISKTWDKITSFFKKTKDETKEIKDMGEKTTTSSKVQAHWSGTNYFGGGLTTLAERGAELVEMNNSSYLVNSPVMANLPRGARILNNSQTRSSLSSRVSSLKDRIRSISNDSRTTVGGDTITININGSSGNATDIAREVKRVLEEIESKKRRTAII